MGFHTRDIKEKCAKCTEYHIKKLIPGSDFPADWCTLADAECCTIKSCDKKALAWIKKDPHDGFLPEEEPQDNETDIPARMDEGDQE